MLPEWTSEAGLARLTLEPVDLRADEKLEVDFDVLCDIPTDEDIGEELEEKLYAVWPIPFKVDDDAELDVEVLEYVKPAPARQIVSGFPF